MNTDQPLTRPMTLSVFFNERELRLLSAALRHWQQTQSKGVEPAWKTIETHAGRLTSLKGPEIDTLNNKLNVGFSNLDLRGIAEEQSLYDYLGHLSVQTPDTCAIVTYILGQSGQKLEATSKQDEGFSYGLQFDDSEVARLLEDNSLPDTPHNRDAMRSAITGAAESEAILAEIREQIADGIASDREDDPTSWEVHP